MRVFIYTLYLKLFSGKNINTRKTDPDLTDTFLTYRSNNCLNIIRVGILSEF